jgi:succinyl-CoA synthetase beta subunit
LTRPSAASFQARNLAFGSGNPERFNQPGGEIYAALYEAYEKMDASLLEINPFLLTKDNRLIALDAKVNFDDNALFRHRNYADLRDTARKNRSKPKPLNTT